MRFILISLASAAICGTPAYSSQKISLPAAIAQCKSLDGASKIAQENYRTCVRAKSGKDLPPQESETGIKITGSARIGIVVNK